MINSQIKDHGQAPDLAHSIHSHQYNQDNADHR